MVAAKREIQDRIGRYEVSGRIALGGMAELLLGRLSGPSGFDKPVVIKRILPHLADVPAFVDMFLDEARTAARIQHPNVAQVFELGHEDGELFLVMEYLQGETLATLLRRLTARGERLPPALAAFICSGASAGLHAAHEICDLDGNNIGLVHRDVSPQNIFVTYDGVVKVLDFGIATSADRVTKTEVGEIKGKIAYMSPEQAKGEALDRRSDIFALGVVLFETVLGKRLFKRSSSVATITAVVSDPIPRLREVDDAVPQVLDAICQKSLKRTEDERYATASSLRHELATFTASHGTDAKLQDDLADTMLRLFPDRKAEKSELLRRFRVGAPIDKVPVGDVEVSVELPSVAIDISDLSPVTQPPKKKSSMWLLIAGLSVMAVAASVLWTTQVPKHEVTSVELPLRGSDTETPNKNVTQAEANKPITPPSKDVELLVNTQPQGAKVFLNDVSQGETPLSIQTKQSDGTLELRFEKEGYKSHVRRVQPKEDVEVKATLKRLRKKRAPSTKMAPSSQPMNTTMTKTPPSMKETFQAW